MSTGTTSHQPSEAFIKLHLDSTSATCEKCFLPPSISAGGMKLLFTIKLVHILPSHFRSIVILPKESISGDKDKKQVYLGNNEMKEDCQIKVCAQQRTQDSPKWRVGWVGIHVSNRDIQARKYTSQDLSAESGVSSQDLQICLPPQKMQIKQKIFLKENTQEKAKKSHISRKKCKQESASSSDKLIYRQFFTKLQCALRPPTSPTNLLLGL